VKGRKRHIVTDMQGHLLHVKVHAANVHDTVAGCDVFEAALQKYICNRTTNWKTKKRKKPIIVSFQ